MTASKILLYLCLAFIVGIFIGSVFALSLYVLEAVLILGIFLISVFWPFGGLRVNENRKKTAIIGFSILFLVLGIWRCQSIEIQISKSKLWAYNDRKETITLTGIVAEEPDIRDKSLKLIIKPDNINGRILITASRYPEYQYGDKLKITGKLETPAVFEGFNYKDYLKKDGIYSTINWPKIEPLGANSGNPIMKTLLSFKNKFKETSRSFISPPQEGFLEALIFGDESLVSSDWKTKLNLTGTRHITAVSGMNITILAFIILSFALSLGLWRQQAFFVSIFLLLLYILMIGAPASAVRAGIMAFILMTAQYFGRLSTASRAIVFAACLMLWFNPLLLRLDVGFQLSFLAILGMAYLQPIFSSWLGKIPDFKIFPIKTTLSATLSAQFFTLPILMYNFGYIPVLSPIANILIVPLLAPITILILIFGIFGMIFYLPGLVFSWPVWFSLTYIITVVDWFSKIPLTSLAIKNIHFIWLIILYLILSSFAFWLNRRAKLKFLRY